MAPSPFLGMGPLPAISVALYFATRAFFSPPSLCVVLGNSVLRLMVCTPCCSFVTASLPASFSRCSERIDGTFFGEVDSAPPLFSWGVVPLAIVAYDHPSFFGSAFFLPQWILRSLSLLGKSSAWLFGPLPPASDFGIRLVMDASVLLILLTATAASVRLHWSIFSFFEDLYPLV